MTFRYTVADADLLAVRRFHRSRPEGRKEVSREYVGGLLGGCVAGAALVLVPWARTEDVPLTGALALLGAVLVVWTLLYLYLLRHADARLVKQKREVSCGDHQLTLSPEGVQEIRR